MRSFRLVMSVVLAVAFGCPAAGQSVTEGLPTESEECPGEGKDPVCGHFQATVARLLAEDGLLAAEADEDTDVTACFLDIELDPVAQTVTGTNTVTAVSGADGLATFTLDLRDNMVADSVMMGGLPAGFVRAGHTIEITLDRPYDVGESFAVVVAYHGSPQKLGFGSFDWSAHNGTVVASSLSEPWYAHTWWPCKDSLGDKFTLDMWVTVPDWMLVASNGLLVGTDTITGSKLRYRWHESYPIAAYLVSLAATNYVTWTETYSHAGGSMPVQFFAYPESESTVRSGTTDLVTQIETFSREDVYGQYPFVSEKYGIAQFPWSGGMEHQTITSQGAFSSWLNAHELAHQWWGDAITCGTWHDIWLNEGFASFSEAMYLEKRPGGTAAEYRNRMAARRPSSFGGSVYVYDATSLSNVFSTTNVYNKGAWVVHQFRHVLGDETFFDLLAAYRAAFEGGSAITDDLQALAEVVSGRDLAWFFDEWVYGVGAPYYRYGWEQEQIGSQQCVRLRVEQTQTSYPIFTMPIDITLTTGSGATTSVIWNDAASEWYVLPADGTVTSLQFDKDTWILRGSATSTTYVDGPVKLITAVPAPGAVRPRMPAAGPIVLGFSEGISYTDADFTVTGSDGVQPVTVSYDPVGYTVTLTLVGGLPGGDTYTVRVSDAVQSAAGGLSLDGEVSAPTDPAALPSGDGQAGGEAVFTFRVASYGDLDADGDVDGFDFLTFSNCYNGSNHEPLPGCETAEADIEGDVDVDGFDFLTFANCYNGSGRAPLCLR